MSDSDNDAEHNMTEEEYKEVLQELGAIEVQLESLKNRREELIEKLREDGLVGVKVTPAGLKMRNARERRE